MMPISITPPRRLWRSRPSSARISLLKSRHPLTISCIVRGGCGGGGAVLPCSSRGARRPTRFGGRAVGRAGGGQAGRVKRSFSRRVRRSPRNRKHLPPPPSAPRRTSPRKSCSKERRDTVHCGWQSVPSRSARAAADRSG